MNTGGWARGSVAYRDHAPGDRGNPRIVVDVRVGSSTVLMVVDTGATWCVLDPEVAALARVAPGEHDPRVAVVIRGDRWDGHVVRATLALQADDGQDLVLDATVFVPALDPGDEWRHPSFLGYSGALERIRFAVDPGARRIWFAPL
jgi:hypothetical protein